MANGGWSLQITILSLVHHNIKCGWWFYMCNIQGYFVIFHSWTAFYRVTTIADCTELLYLMRSIATCTHLCRLCSDLLFYLNREGFWKFGITLWLWQAHIMDVCGVICINLHQNLKPSTVNCLLFASLLFSRYMREHSFCK